MPDIICREIPPINNTVPVPRNSPVAVGRSTTGDIYVAYWNRDQQFVVRSGRAGTNPDTWTEVFTDLETRGGYSVALCPFDGTMAVAYSDGWSGVVKSTTIGTNAPLVRMGGGWNVQLVWLDGSGGPRINLTSGDGAGRVYSWISDLQGGFESSQLVTVSDPGSIADFDVCLHRYNVTTNRQPEARLAIAYLANRPADGGPQVVLSAPCNTLDETTGDYWGSANPVAPGLDYAPTHCTVIAPSAVSGPVLAGGNVYVGIDTRSGGLDLYASQGPLPPMEGSWVFRRTSVPPFDEPGLRIQSPDLGVITDTIDQQNHVNFTLGLAYNATGGDSLVAVRELNTATGVWDQCEKVVSRFHADANIHTPAVCWDPSDGALVAVDSAAGSGSIPDVVDVPLEDPGDTSPLPLGDLPANPYTLAATPAMPDSASPSNSPWAGAEGSGGITLLGLALLGAFLTGAARRIR
ncbi:MAG TPA: hypothetical protein VEI97_09505 [bacterium]|nr:hypothetical protein [bacterium]